MTGATSSAGGIRVSVVVPVLNAARWLPRCLTALQAQDFPRESFEILCVDNGSVDGSRDVVQRTEGVRLLQVSRRGASAARNAGVRESRGTWVAFTDADCIPQPGWLAALGACAHGPEPADLIGGRIVAHRPRTAVEHFCERLFDQERAIREFRPPYAISANLMVRRDWLLAIGGFDEEFLRGQDVELSFRAHFRHAARFAYAGDAVVEHVNPASAAALWRKALQHGQASAGIHARFGPELGTTMRRRALAPKRYRAIARLAGAAALEGLRFARPARGAMPNERLYELILEAGKQVGFVRTWLAARGDPGASR